MPTSRVVLETLSGHPDAGCSCAAGRREGTGDAPLHAPGSATFARSCRNWAGSCLRNRRRASGGLKFQVTPKDLDTKVLNVVGGPSDSLPCKSTTYAAAHPSTMKFRLGIPGKQVCRSGKNIWAPSQLQYHHQAEFLAAVLAWKKSNDRDCGSDFCDFASECELPVRLLRGILRQALAAATHFSGLTFGASPPSCVPGNAKAAALPSRPRLPKHQSHAGQCIIRRRQWNRGSPRRCGDQSRLG